MRQETSLLRGLLLCVRGLVCMLLLPDRCNCPADIMRGGRPGGAGTRGASRRLRASAMRPGAVPRAVCDARGCGCCSRRADICFSTTLYQCRGCVRHAWCLLC